MIRGHDTSNALFRCYSLSGKWPPLFSLESEASSYYSAPWWIIAYLPLSKHSFKAQDSPPHCVFIKMLIMAATVCVCAELQRKGEIEEEERGGEGDEKESRGDSGL